MNFFEDEGDKFTSNIFKNYLGMPVWQLRHLEVSRYIDKQNITKVLDIGCAEGTLINRLSRSERAQLLVGVDFDSNVLQLATDNVQPQLIQDQISYTRINPLHIRLYKADVFQNLPLESKTVQLITMIEFIEHIDENKVQKLSEIVFGEINPPHIFITTPNAEFNVWFNFTQGQMRHPDHLYQWERQKFQAFVEKMAEQYGYQYKIIGIGEHINDDKYGCCSQGAIFKRKNQNLSGKQIKQISQNKIEKIIQVKYPLWKQKIKTLIKTYLFDTVFKNNYSTLNHIKEAFLCTKIGKKLQIYPQFCTEENLPNYQDNAQEKQNLVFQNGCDENFLKIAIQRLKCCGYDQQRDYAFYEYEQSEGEMENMTQEDQQYWIQEQRRFKIEMQLNQQKQKNPKGQRIARSRQKQGFDVSKQSKQIVAKSEMEEQLSTW